MSILQNLERINHNIKFDSTKAVFVERKSLKTLNQLIFLGFEHFVKASSNIVKTGLKDKVNWHYVGKITFTNSFNIVKNFDYIHQRCLISNRIVNFWAKLLRKKLNIFLPLKYLIAYDLEALKRIIINTNKLKNINIVGFSGIVNPIKVDKNVIYSFAKDQFDNLKLYLYYSDIKLKYLSMGNMEDLNISSANGGNFFILGNKLFQNSKNSELVKDISNT